ncbi:MAG TPA: alginate export family protein, partial [Geobacteraceae bacterium]
LHLGEAFRFFAQLKSSLEDGRVGGPRSTDQDELDLHQLFGEGRWAITPDTNAWLRLGRQELAFGSQRLVSVREGPNVRQSFDGLRASYTTMGSRMDCFIARPVETNQYVFDDGSDNSRALWGAYAVLPFPLLPNGKVDLYYLGLYRREARFDQGTARETRHSVGTRLWGKEAGLDYNFEFVYQFGSFGGSDIQAWTVASDTGYGVKDVLFAPRLGLKANVASGDRDPANRDLETFNPLFPKGAYFSEANLIGPANFADLHPSIELLPFRQLTVTFDWDFFWRESNRDGIYGNAVNLVRSGQGSRAWYVGSQPQVQLEWRVDRHLTFVAQYAHFLAGPFIKESGPGNDVDYATSWVTYKF